MNTVIKLLSYNMLLSVVKCLLLIVSIAYYRSKHRHVMVDVRPTTGAKSNEVTPIIEPKNSEKKIIKINKIHAKSER